MFRTTRTAFVLFTLFSCITFSVQAQPTLNADFLLQKRVLVEKWLEETGLDNQFEILKLRKSVHPDPVTVDKIGYRLELRFRSESAANRSFNDFLYSQSRTLGQPLPAYCFYKFVNLIGVNREFASVHFHVQEAEYEVYLDASRQLVMREAVRKGLNHQRMLVDLKPLKSNTVTIGQASDDKDLARRVQHFLDEYFKSSASDIKSNAVFQPLERHFVGVSVDGIKGRVIKSHNYWERIELNLELKPDGKKWEVACYYDGEYAASFSKPPPRGAYASMEKGFQAELRTYISGLLTNLQKSLEKER